MRFLNPSAFSLLALIPIVVLLHFLKLRRQQQIVPSVQMWLSACEETQTNVPFQKLKIPLSLPLQILFLLTVIGSIARPALYRPLENSDQAILIIETSASMNAKHNGKTRFDLAKSESLRLINQLPPDCRIMILDTSIPPNIRSPFTSDKTKLRSTINQLSVQHTSSRLKSVLSAVSNYQTVDTQVFIVSDNFDGLTNLELKNLQMIPIGKRLDNVAIVKFNVTRNLDRPSQIIIFAVLQNFSEISKDFKIRLEIEGNWIDDQPVRMPAGKRSKEIVFTLEDAGLDGHVVTVLFDLDDALSVDNSASAILHPIVKPQVVLVTNRKPFLLIQMLKTNPNIEFNQTNMQDYHGYGDIVIFDQSMPSVLPVGNMIVLAPPNNFPLAKFVESESPAHVIGQDRTHPVLRDIPQLDIEIQKMLIGNLPIWGVPLIEADLGPLVWHGQWNNQRLIVFNFDPFDLQLSPFAISIPAAPMLISQCLDWLIPPKTKIQPDLVRTGEPVKFHLNLERGKSISVLLPNGANLNLTTTPIFTNTSQVGIYTVSVGDQPFGRFAVNLLNATESSLTEKSPPKQQVLVGETQEQMVYVEIWHSIAIFSLLLLVTEWTIFYMGKQN